MRLEGKVALISGGARGIGAATVKKFVEEGARVTIGDILEKEGKMLEREIINSSGHAHFLKLDVTKWDEWMTAVDSAIAKFGRIDVLVNNAGINVSSKGIEDITEDIWDRIMRVNAKGIFLGTKAVIPVMKKLGGGSIINVSSQVGIVGGPSGNAAYHASKGAVRVFTKTVALQNAKDNIRINSVHPGPIDTDMNRRMHEDSEHRKVILSRIPMGRMGQPEEVAAGILYLASAESSFMTGSELVIDGGYTAQ